MIDFKQFRKENNLTQKDAAHYFSVSQAFISQIELGTRPVPDSFISKIKADNLYLVPETEKQYTDSYNSIPLIPLNAMAGFAAGEISILEYECEHYVIPMFQDADFLIQVKGSSMTPKYNSGDLVACKKVPLDTFFQWNKVYVLDTEQGPLIKRIKQSFDNEHIKVVSENKGYDTFDLHRSKIYALAVVVGVVRLE